MSALRQFQKAFGSRAPALEEPADKIHIHLYRRSGVTTIGITHRRGDEIVAFDDLDYKAEEYANARLDGADYQSVGVRLGLLLAVNYLRTKQPGLSDVTIVVNDPDLVTFATYRMREEAMKRFPAFDAMMRSIWHEVAVEATQRRITFRDQMNVDGDSDANIHFTKRNGPRPRIEDLAAAAAAQPEPPAPAHVAEVAAASPADAPAAAAPDLDLIIGDTSIDEIVAASPPPLPPVAEAPAVVSAPEPVAAQPEPISFEAPEDAPFDYDRDDRPASASKIKALTAALVALQGRLPCWDDDLEGLESRPTADVIAIPPGRTVLGDRSSAPDGGGRNLLDGIEALRLRMREAMIAPRDNTDHRTATMTSPQTSRFGAADRPLASASRRKEPDEAELTRALLELTVRVARDMRSNGEFDADTLKFVEWDALLGRAEEHIKKIGRLPG